MNDQSSKKPLSLEEKRALVAKLTAQKSSSNFVPLSTWQEKSWLYQSLDANSPAYNVPVHVHLTGPLQPVAVKKAVQHLVLKHEALRIRFIATNDGVLQTLHPVEKIELGLIDLSSKPRLEQDADLDRIKNENASKPFDLKKDLLFQINLIKISDAEHWLLFRSHQVVFDGLSVFVVLQDFERFYKSFCADSNANPQTVSPGYFHFVHQQSKWEKDGNHKPQIEYWKKALHGSPSRVDFPKDRNEVSTKISSQKITLPIDVFEKMKDYCRVQGLTPFTFMLTAFQMTLSQWTQQDDINVGTVINGRGDFDEASLSTVGEFTNPIVLRAELVGQKLVRQLFEQGKQRVLAAQMNSRCPFQFVVEALNPERGLQQNPFFNITFVMHNQTEMPLQLAPDITAKIDVPAKAIGSEIFLFDLMLQVHSRENTLVVECEFNGGKYSAETIQSFLESLNFVIEQSVGNPDLEFQDLLTVPPTQMHKLVHANNELRQTDTLHLRVPDLINQQCVKTPDAVALIEGEFQLTYRELEERSNQVGHYLQSIGAKPEVLIGVQMERSIDLIIALVGVMKSGAAYVPLDSELPQERLKFLTEEIAAPVILTASHLNADKLANFPKSNVRNLAKMKDPIYVIYTSGSTGQPKGCVNTHEGLANYLPHTQARLRMDSKTRVLNKTPYTFDVSFPEMFAPLIAGGTLVLTKPGGHRDPRYLTECLSKFQIDTLFVVPSMLQILLDEEAISDLNHLTCVIALGEALAPSTVHKFYERLPKARLINEYGPTEAAVTVTSWECSPTDNFGSTPIGFPLPNVELYVLDPKLKPVRPGMIGELYIGGVQVAREYWKRPELTKDRFVKNPVAETYPGALYKTGDRCRQLNNGAFEYLGRTDLQVKIRGFRIELGEIESTLLQHESVADVAVVNKKLHGESQPESLVAYVISKSGDPIDQNSLRDHLAKKVPAYMVPSLFVTLATMPRVGSEKVDRKALKYLKDQAVAVAQTHVPPRNETERKLVVIFQEVLHNKTIGVTDNFFELGGHSLMATQLISKASQVFGREIPMATVFTAPTIEKMSAYIDAPVTRKESIVTLKPSGANPPLFLFHAVDGDILPYIEVLHHLKAELPVYGVIAPALLGLAKAAPTCLKDIAKNYLAALRLKAPRGPYHLAGWSFGGKIAYEVASLLRASGESVASLTIVDTLVYQEPGPTLRQHFMQQMGMTDVNQIEGLTVHQKVHALTGALKTYYKRLSFNPTWIDGLVRGFLGLDGRADLRVLFNHHEADQTYSMHPLTGVSVTLVTCDDTINQGFDSMLGWQPFLQGRVNVVKVNANHFSILREPFAKTLAETIDQTIKTNIVDRRNRAS